MEWDLGMMTRKWIVIGVVWFLGFGAYPSLGIQVTSDMDTTDTTIPLCMDGRFFGKKPDSETISLVLKKHKLWVLEGMKSDEDVRIANFCGASLKERYLPGVTLRKAKLWGINLQKANLERADLQEAMIPFGLLQGAKFLKANLENSNLSFSHLEKTNFTDANFQSAMLIGAKIQGINFSEANLKGARVSNIDFQNVVLQLKPGGIPFIPDFGNAINISKILYDTSPHTLIELRKGFKEAGMRQQEREITYAIEHGRRIRAWNEESFLGPLEAGFKYIMFEFTSNYGMSPGRPLQILALIFCLFSVPYMLALRAYPNQGKIIASFLNKSEMTHVEGRFIYKRATNDQPYEVHVNGEWFFPNIRKFEKLTFLANYLGIVFGGFYFSLLSTFRLGWRDLNVGTWISRIQPRDYTLRATGWVKFVSGMQSLVCVYLLALWALTYFGRPFE